jgi:hypothetical protein
MSDNENNPKVKKSKLISIKRKKPQNNENKQPKQLLLS